MRRILPGVIVLLALPISWAMTNVHGQVITGDFTGGTSYTAIGRSGIIYAFPILITSPRVVWGISVNWAATGLVTVNVALYSNNDTAGSNKPCRLLTDSGFILVDASGGWQDIPVALKSVRFGNYWVAIQISQIEPVFAIPYTRAYYYRAFGTFNSSWPNSNYTLDSLEQWNMRVVFMPPNFVQHLAQQNQMIALSDSLRAASCWERTTISKPQVCDYSSIQFRITTSTATK